MIDCINNIDNYALTGHTSVYNEDGLTAQQLLILCAKRIKECVNVCEDLHARGYNIINARATYNADSEEIAITLEKILRRANYITRHYFLFNENAKSVIELAGSINKAINECLNVLAKVCSALGDNPGATTLKALIDNAYVDVYDDCAFTILELAGITAKNVNALIEIINKLEDITINIITYGNEEYVTVFDGNENETIIL